MSTQNSSPLEQAIAATDGVANLAKACNVSAQAVYKWLEKGRPPVSRCEAIERASGGKVSRFDLLPPEFSAAPGRSRRKPSSLPDPK